MNNKIRQQNVGYDIPFLNHGRNFLPRANISALLLIISPAALPLPGW